MKRWLPVKAATIPAASGCPRNDKAADCSRRPTPRCGRPAPPPTSCPRPRSRASASGGSLRLPSTRCSPGGRCWSENPSDCARGVNQVIVIKHLQRLARIRLRSQFR